MLFRPNALIYPVACIIVLLNLQPVMALFAQWLTTSDELVNEFFTYQSLPLNAFVTLALILSVATYWLLTGLSGLLALFGDIVNLAIVAALYAAFFSMASMALPNPASVLVAIGLMLLALPGFHSFSVEKARTSIMKRKLVSEFDRKPSIFQRVRTARPYDGSVQYRKHETGGLTSQKTDD